MRLDPLGVPPYHSMVAERKNTRKNKKGDSNTGCLLLLALLLLLIGLVLLNRETLGKNLRDTRFVDRVLHKEPTKPAPPAAPQPVQPDPKQLEREPETVLIPKSAPQPELPPAPEEDTKPTPPAQPTPAPSTPAKTAPTAAPPAKPQTPVQTAKEFRERTLWFVRIEDDGVIARIKTKRSLESSDSPLMDSINALMAGPSSTEQKKGYSSLIPPGTRLLAATVRGSTAYLSFNDQFQFNSYGIEGYATQLRQIIWTATEFESVKDVQFLIEGRRVDYLGAEGIFIGSPLGRDSI